MHSPLARAMHTALRNVRLTDKFQDPLYLFLELVRAGVMHGHLWSGRAFSGGPSFGTGAYPCFCSYDGGSHGSSWRPSPPSLEGGAGPSG